jgi:hypothetical protein
MGGDSAAGLWRRIPFTPGRVRQVATPLAARALSTLRVDYDDTFLVEIDPAHHGTGEQLARAIFEDASVLLRSALRRGWFALGLRLGSTEDDRLVLGWEVRRSGPDFVLLGTRSRLGLTGEVLFTREQQALLLTTFVQLENQMIRAVWRGVAPLHRQVVRHLLGRAKLTRTAPTLRASRPRYSSAQ